MIQVSWACNGMIVLRGTVGRGPKSCVLTLINGCPVWTALTVINSSVVFFTALQLALLTE